MEFLYHHTIFGPQMASEARADEALAAAAATLAAKEEAAAEMKAPGWFQPAMGLNIQGVWWPMVAWNWLYHIRIASGNWLYHFALAEAYGP